MKNRKLYDVLIGQARGVVTLFLFGIGENVACDGDDLDRERIATLNLIYDLACEVLAAGSAVGATEELDLPESIRGMLRKSLVAARQRIFMIERAEKRITARWRGAPDAKATILAGLSSTRAEIQKRIKLYDRGLIELKDASFEPTIESIVDEVAKAFREREAMWKRLASLGI